MGVKRKFQIPARLKLSGYTVLVEQFPPIRWKHSDCVGLFEPEEMRIRIRKGRKDIVGHTFTHELTHAILCAMDHPLYSDEEFVHTFSGLLYQALSTAEYPP